MTARAMSPQDSLWLELDRPTNLMVITSLMWTATPVDPERLRSLLRDRLLARYPVFRQRPEFRSGLLRSGTWVDDEDFDLARHLVVGTVPAVGDRAALRAFIGAERARALDPAHPLWRIHLLQGYRGGSALVQQYHHSLADGIRLTQVMLGMLDPVDGGDTVLSARVGRRTPVTALPEPAGSGMSLLSTLGSLIKITLWSNPGSALEGRPGTAKSVAWTEPVPLETLSRIAKASGTTVNDVCTTLVAGAVSRYLEDAPAGRPGLPGGDEDLAWMVPVNLEAADREPPPELGNHFALVLAVLPHGPAAFRDRLLEVHRRMARIRRSWEPVLTYGLAWGIARSPSLVGTTASRIMADKAVGVLTNVPGPRTPMSLAGARVEGAVAWAPCSGHQSITACIFSYGGGITFGFGTDDAVIPDPDRFVAGLADELAAAEQSVPA